MNINLAVKSSQNEKQLKKVLNIAEKFEVKGLEIQEIIPTMENIKTEKRAKIVVDAVRGYSIEFLAYHFPIKSRWDSIEEAKKYDLAWGSDEIIKLSKETIEEAVIVARELDIDNDVPVNFHLFRFIERDKISIQEKIEGLKVGEAALVSLKTYADELCRSYGLDKNGEAMIKITRENNPPDHGFVDGLIDYHPIEVARTKEKGIWNCLDFAHIWQYMNYLKYGKGELPGADIDRELYPTDLGWKKIINILKDNILLIHVNDASGYKKETEGLEVCEGEIDYIHVFSVIKNYLKDINNTMFTIEIKDGHLHPEKIERSISRVHEIIEII